MPTIYVSSTRDEVRDLLLQLPAILSGKVPDVGGIAHGFKVRIAAEFFAVIKEEFIVKSRGGTDAAGIKWPKLSPAYLAYGRGPKSTRTAGGKSPGGKDGFMSAAQLKQWRQIYGHTLARLAQQIGLGEAKARAAAIAWVAMKKRGVKTKLAVFGQRDVEILRDRDILFNSLSPGIVTEAGTDANYAPPSLQVADVGTPGEIIVGTNVTYAKYHQGTPAKPGRRPMWPQDGNLPQVWWDDIIDSAINGLLKVGEIL